VAGLATRPLHPALAAGALLAGIAGAALVARGSALSGAALLLGSVLALRLPGSFWSIADPAELPATTRRLLLLAIAAVAAFYRGYRMVPPGLWGDDAINGLLAYDILDGKITSPFQLVSHSASRFHALSNYLIAASFAAFGANLATLRLPGVILNFLCVLLVYGTFAPLFRARVALIAALLFAIAPQQLSYAKILVQLGAGEFFHLLAMCLLVRGIHGTRRWLIAASGVPLGLALCTYHSFKLAPLVAVAYGLDTLATRRDRSRALAPWLLAGAATFALAALPGIAGYAADPLALTGRISGTSVLRTIEQQGNLWPLWESVWRTLATFHHQQGPVSYHWFGIGTDPALDVVAAGLVLHGLAQSVAGWRESRHRLLLAWFLVGLVPGLLSSDAPRAYRIILAMPPLFVWAALPIERLFAGGAAEPRRARSFALAGFTLLAAASLVSFNDYFVRTYSHSNYLWLQGSRMVDIARTVRDFGKDWKAYLVSTTFNASHESLALLKRMWGIDIVDATAIGAFMPRQDEAPALLVFDPGAQAGVEAVQAWYPGAYALAHHQPPEKRWFFDGWFAGAPQQGRTMTSYMPLAAGAIASARGLDALYLDAAGAPLGTARWNDLTLPPAGQARALPPGTTRVVLTGSLAVPASGVHRFQAQGGSRLSLSLDGQQVLAPDADTGSLDLVEGLHSLAALVHVDATEGFRVLWKTTGRPLHPIPPTALYRQGEPRGWLVEWTTPRGIVRRLDPFPWYQFLSAPVEGATAARWRGRLRVPQEGRWLEIRSRGAMTVMVDGQPWRRSDPLPAGDHDIDLRLDELQGAPMLVLQWGARGAPARPIPPSAFLPPPPAAG